MAKGRSRRRSPGGGGGGGSGGGAVEVLVRAYGDRARSLKDAILALLPPPPPAPAACRCGGGGCLGCGSAAHLLRPGDPAAYRALLARAVCAVSPAAPPPPVLFAVRHRQPVTQRMIVKNMTELILDSSLSNSNVLCGNYDKRRCFSPVGEFLCSSAWNLLLVRIGSPLMAFLLRHSSIFMPIMNNCYHQVTGSRLDVVLENSGFLRTSFVSKNKKVALKNKSSSGLKVKRKRDEFEERLNADATLRPHHPSIVDNSIEVDVISKSISENESCVLNNCTPQHCKPLMPLSSSLHAKDMQLQQAVPTGSKDMCNSLCSLVTDASEESSKRGKRKRLFSWQRRKKYKEHFRKGTFVGTIKPIVSDINANNQPTQPDKEMKSFYDLGILGVQSTILQETQAEISYGHSVVSDLPDKGPQTELSSKCAGTSENLRELPNCSEQNDRKCFINFMLHACRKLPMDAEVKRRYIFYNRSWPFSVFPRKHILNRLKPNNSGAISLMKHIFGFSGGCSDLLHCTHCSSYRICKAKCLYHSLLHLFKSLIRNAQRCQYRKLLLKHCHVTTFKKSNKDNDGAASKENNHGSNSSEDSDPCLDPSQSFCKGDQVVSFLWAVSRSIVPSSLLGNSSSWRCLRKNIGRFVRLRRFENFYLKGCIRGLKISSFPFLSQTMLSVCSFDRQKAKYKYGNSENVGMDTKISKNTKRKLHRNFVHRWIYWFFNYLVVPIIRANFYVTERESKRYDVFYYAKPVWRKLVKTAIVGLKEHNYELLDPESLRCIFHNKPFPFSRVRFLPKDKTIRPLANLKSSRWMHHPHNKLDRFGMRSNGRKNFLYCKSVNSSLQELHTVLRRVKAEHSEFLGSSVFDYNDVYQNFHQFLCKLKNGSKGLPDVFIVAADVSKAFDSIKHDMLFKIMVDAIADEGYFIRKYARLVCTKKSSDGIYNRVSYGCISSCASGSSAPEASIQLSSSFGVFVDQAKIQRITKSELLDCLCDHLKCNALQLGRDFYIQKLGIPQGSVLSSLLCSFYYGELERSIIMPYLEKTCKQSDGSTSMPNHLLLRLIDDFLFISTSKNLATSFFDRLRGGVSDYNCFMNDKKYGLNFDVEHSDRILNRVYTGDDGISFVPWSGLLINCRTLEIQADYTSYMHSLINKRMHDMELYNIHPVFRLKKAETVWLGLYAYIRMLRKKQSRHKELLALLKSRILMYDGVDYNSPHLNYAVDDSHSSVFWKLKF
ncbi:telomerase reverse transcriptase isoform X2 [Ananas comosus]|uniref:Telomerase reverse transcriptase n=1 Tax=Ananas comosus TaxID=4615 RepID=A0A6P5GUF5_ANACO|nr:telomerase reverse transcriptase isoform X2 [Ananas comosus]